MASSIPQALWSDILPAARRTVLVAWALAAVLNLSAGVVLAFQPGRQSDLASMQRWGREWLGGANVYLTGGELPEYPPNAIVFLSPLAAISDGWGVPIWAALNIALALAAAYLAVRAVQPAFSVSAAALPMLMFLCWGGFRTLLQFSLITVTLGLLAVVLADEYQVWGGMCLGLALVKPQMAAPFLLWTLFAKRLRVAAIAVGVAIGGWAAFCLWAGADPVGLVVRYVEILRTYYLGDAVLVGLSNLRPLIGPVVSNVATVDVLTVSIGLLSLVGVCAAGFMERPRDDRLMASAPPLAALWSLLTFYHLTYGFIVLLPVATLFLFANDPRTRVLRTRAFWAMQVALMIDVPGAWRYLEHVLGPSEIASLLLDNADRVLMLALSACVAAQAYCGSQRTEYQAVHFSPSASEKA